MQVFHSGTDKGDLYENTPKLPLFLSLIVNYKEEFDCELALSMKVEKTLLERVVQTVKGVSKQQKKIDKTSNVDNMVYLYKCDMWYELEEVDPWFTTQCDSLKVKPKQGIVVHDTMSTYSRPTGLLDKTEYSAVKPYVQNKVYANVADLFSLGEMYSDVPIKECLKRVDECVTVSNKEEYTKAFKMYFVDYWFPATFYNMPNSNEMEVLTAIRRILENHNTWIVGPIKQALNDYEREYTDIWQVQEPAVVS